MKQQLHRLLCCMLLACGILFTACHAEPPSEDPGVPAPCILLNGTAYYAPEMPVQELPPGYEYAGVLDTDEAGTTGLAGCRMYMDPAQQPVTDFYLYQETGTPIDSNTVDTTRRQWMYVRWSLPKE